MAVLRKPGSQEVAGGGLRRARVREVPMHIVNNGIRASKCRGPIRARGYVGVRMQHHFGATGGAGGKVDESGIGVCGAGSGAPTLLAVAIADIIPTHLDVGLPMAFPTMMQCLKVGILGSHRP